MIDAPPQTLIEEFTCFLLELARTHDSEKGSEPRNLRVHEARELARRTALAVEVYGRDRHSPRPAEIARKLAVAAKALRRAANNLDGIGAKGMDFLAAGSNSAWNQDGATPDALVLAIANYARWCEAGAGAAKEHKSSLRNDRGGPTADEALRDLVRILAVAWRCVMRIRPTHTIATMGDNEGMGASLFDRYVAKAIRHFVPGGAFPTQRLIDDAIRDVLRRTTPRRR